MQLINVKFDYFNKPSTYTERLYLCSQMWISNPVEVIELKFKFAYRRKEINKDSKDLQDANTKSIDFSTMQFYTSIIRIL